MKNILVGILIGAAAVMVFHPLFFGKSDVEVQVVQDPEKETRMYDAPRVSTKVQIEKSVSPENREEAFDFYEHANLCASEAITQAEKIGDKIPIYILHQWMERNTEEAIKWEMRLRGKPPYPIFKD